MSSDRTWTASSLTSDSSLQIEREAEQRVLKKIHEKRPDVDLSGIDLEEDPIINGVDEHRTESLGSHRSSTVKGRSTRGRSQIATEGAPSKRRRVH